jgi:hypothetical protein
MDLPDIDNERLENIMTPSQANQWSNRAFGAMIVAGFGAMWLLLGLYLRQQLNAASVAWISGGVLTLWSLSAYMLRRVERPSQNGADTKRSRAFHWINGGQWVAIFLALTILRQMHLDLYSVTVMAAIVGLHFLPLARLFRNPMNWMTGILLISWAICATRLVNADRLQSTTALGTGAILWFSAVLTLVIGTYAVRGTRALSRQPYVA